MVQSHGEGYLAIPLPISSSEFLKKNSGAPRASQGLISVAQGELWPLLQASSYGAGLLFTFMQRLPLAFTYLTAERLQQRPGSFYRHSLKASARKQARIPYPPPTHSSLTMGRLCCSSFRRIQSFNSTRRLEAEYTKKGTRKPLLQDARQANQGGDEGRSTARRADSFTACRRMQPGVSSTGAPGSGPHAPRRGNTSLAAGRPARPAIPAATYPARTARRSPRSDLRKKESGCQPAPRAGAAPVPRWATAPRGAAGAGPSPGPGPGRPPPAPGSR